VMAAIEMENLEKGRIGAGKTVLLDDYFNHEVRPDGSVWHYKWSEKNHPGFYAWGKQFESSGATLDTLSAAPTAANLKNADVYIIVDPDTEKETGKPNFISAAAARAIAGWVKAGGVLVLMGNDFGNAEFDNFNVLAKQFGIEFNKNSKYRVQNNNFVEGKITVSGDNPIFKTGKTLYLKEVSTLSVSAPARAILEANGEKIMATAKYGKGTVFAVGDPWLYNEYTDGRKLPAGYQNLQAAQDLSAWLLAQARKKK